MFKVISFVLKKNTDILDSNYIGHGIVLGIHDGENHNYDIVRYMNFSKKIHDSLLTLSWQQVFKEEMQG